MERAIVTVAVEYDEKVTTLSEVEDYLYCGVIRSNTQYDAGENGILDVHSFTIKDESSE